MNLPADPVKKSTIFQHHSALKNANSPRSAAIGRNTWKNNNEPQPKIILLEGNSWWCSRAPRVGPNSLWSHQELSVCTRIPQWPATSLTYKRQSVIYFCLLMLTWIISEKPLAAISFCSRQPKPSRTDLYPLLKLMAEHCILPDTAQSNDTDAKMEDSIIQLGCVLRGIIATCPL